MPAGTLITTSSNTANLVVVEGFKCYIAKGRVREIEVFGCDATYAAPEPHSTASLTKLKFSTAPKDLIEQTQQRWYRFISETFPNHDEEWRMGGDTRKNKL